MSADFDAGDDLPFPTDAQIREQIEVIMKEEGLESISTKKFIVQMGKQYPRRNFFASLSEKLGGFDLSSKKDTVMEIIDAMDSNPLRTAVSKCKPPKTLYKGEHDDVCYMCFSGGGKLECYWSAFLCSKALLTAALLTSLFLNQICCAAIFARKHTI